MLARDGNEAVEQWAHNGPFDLILMDLEMPRTGGPQAVEPIRKLEESTEAHVPIIAMTSHGDVVEELCLSSGMDAYISKPIEAEALFSAVTALTRPGSQTLRLDRARISRRLGGDECVLGDVARSFLKNSLKQLKAIRLAIEELDAGTVHFEAHSLKGAICYFETGHAFEAARRLEKRGRDSQLGGAEIYLKQLEVAIEPLRQAVADMLQSP